MSIFDELGKKVTQTGQSVAQKTKDMADTAKINSMVADEEKKINNGYYQIGKMYLSLHENDYEDQYASLVHMIRESENKITTYYRQIQNIKGVRKCPNCGAEIPMSAVFCVSCGMKVPSMPAPAPTPAPSGEAFPCPNCGAMIKSGAKFCTSCGTPINMESAPVQTPIQETPEQGMEEVKSDAEPEAVRCPVCGHLQEGDSMFCTECGAKLGAF